MITANQLLKILPNLKHADVISKAFNDTCEKYDISNRNRMCHFLAQIIHESGGFRYSKELATGIKYEWRKDLGNVRHGDGQKYVGRGYIQITGRYNYLALSKAFSINFVSKPSLLE